MSALLGRVQSEYLEMPGLKLTEAQARRLWGLDDNTCGVVLATLIKQGFLKRSANGTYVRVD
jgi:predicted transcriptional regulator of viral defense system